MKTNRKNLEAHVNERNEDERAYAYTVVYKGVEIS
jgi:hypothetical protein